MSNDTEGEGSIWLHALGYFAAYVPYAALTKALTSSALVSVPRSGLSLLPVSTVVSMLGMIVFLSWRGWWKLASATRIGRFSIPTPRFRTFVSGLATAAVIGTTTLSYTIEGTSILVMMLLMRGGVLVIAPIVDLASRRKVRWQAWVALGLSLGALLVGVDDGDIALGATGATVIGVYLVAYFIRLRIMSGQAKSGDPRDARRYFVEEQMVATPAIVALLALLAVWGRGDVMQELRLGFTDLGPPSRLALVAAVGLFSQGTGIFGALTLLDGRENSFCVPVNRASSVLAGVAASGALYVLVGGAAVPARELGGAAILVAAIVLLAMSGKRPAPSAPASPSS